ncbi:SMP-30/gluconolactonase/LRE family protein [Chachezhania sediminis]|uniref:SMP-30/gluconolactonase/LRE family protein n=1 Tax=Chachezhania sediminis TaxID=2599291 RepID=UPI00131DD2FC|nr:SMP-30/gluconolactonase/LRE family protein [Chachezhania sediminis]
MTTQIFDPRTCELGEGPLWHPERQQFFWFDIIGMRLLSRDGDTPLEWSLGEHASAAGWIDRGTMLIATETGLRRFDIDSGDHEPVIALEAGNPANRSNDGRTDPMGGFWIGTMGKAAEPRAGAIYRFYGGAVEKIVPDVSIPNAICFAPDGRTAYHADTRRQRIWAQPLDAAGWPDGPAEVFVDLRPEGLNPDGAVIDADGALWNAQWGAGRVARYLPDGTFDRAIAVAGHHASCPCFGGADLDRMIVTTACEGIEAPDDAQGLVYAVDPGVRGLREYRVKA